MSYLTQKTIKNKVSFSGVALHSGHNVNIVIRPAEPDCGIVFKRVDLDQNNLVVANYKNVTSAKLCTTLENDFGVRVSTVEHLLAALYLADIDNAIIEIDSEEVPIMDGSAKDFLKELQKIDLKRSTKKRKYLKVIEKVELKDNCRKIFIEPNSSSTFEVDFQLNYKNKTIGKQENLVNFQLDQLDQVCQSRTFCLFEDIEKIKKFSDNPIVAIGGINEKNYRKLLLNKANFLAISGYIWNNNKYKPYEAIERLK